MECKCISQTNESSLTIWISILALVISVVAIVIEKHINKSQLRIDFFAEHFKEALSKTIPNARNKIRFEGERVKGCEELQDALANMRREADYFRFADPRFYNRFVKVNQEAEDYFISGLNKNYGEDRQREFFKEGDRILKKLYRVINKKYFG